MKALLEHANFAMIQKIYDIGMYRNVRMKLKVFEKIYTKMKDENIDKLLEKWRGGGERVMKMMKIDL